MKSFVKKISLIFFGLLLALITLELSMWIVGFAVSGYHSYKNNRMFKKDSQYTVVCIGESTTAGQYPVQLQRILDKKYPNKFSVIDCGVPSIPIEDILARLDGNINKYKPDIVICMMTTCVNPLSINNNQNADVKFRGFKLYKLIKGYFLFFKQLQINKVISKSANEFKNDNTENKMQEAIDLKNQKKSKQAVIVLKEILDINPNHEEANKMLMNIYYYFGKQFKEFGDRIADKIVSSDSFKNKSDCYEIIFKANLKFGDLKKLKIYSDKAIEKDSYMFETPKGYLLYGLIRDVITPAQKRELIKLMSSQSDIFYGFMAVNYMEQKNYKKAKKYFEEADNMRINYCTPKEHGLIYKKIISTLIDNDIKVICMQYPVRSIESLKKMLENEEYFNKITFISNEENFKQALKEKKYNEIFCDQFAGDFGHCTDLGNTMIAENVVKSLENLLN